MSKKKKDTDAVLRDHKNRIDELEHSLEIAVDDLRIANDQNSVHRDAPLAAMKALCRMPTAVAIELGIVDDIGVVLSWIIKVERATGKVTDRG